MNFNKKNSLCWNTWCKFHDKKSKKCTGVYAEIEKEFLQTGYNCPRDKDTRKVVRFEEVYEDHVFYYNKLRLQKEGGSEGISKEGSRLQFVLNQLVTIYD